MIDYIPSDPYPIGIAIGIVLLIWAFGRALMRGDRLPNLIMRAVGLPEGDHRLMVLDTKVIDSNGKPIVAIMYGKAGTGRWWVTR
jgi:hypothetical protein